MKTDSTVLTFQHPDDFDDPLTSVLRDGARRLLAQAVEAEADAFRSVRSRRGSAQFRCGAPSCATVVAMQQARWAADRITFT